MDDLQSYKNKIVDFGTRKGSFKDDSGRSVDYTQIVLVISVDGVETDVVLSGSSAPKPAFLDIALRGADEVEA